MRCKVAKMTLKLFLDSNTTQLLVKRAASENLRMDTFGVVLLRA